MADRISNLPRCVINHILTYLPFDEAVRTSILSREWRYKWRSIPHLVFDRKLEQGLNGDHDLESVIDDTLLEHSDNITKFSLKLSDSKIYPINVWLILLSWCPIEDLELEFSNLGLCRVMPDHLFGFNSLEHLYIKFCEIKLPPTYNGFSRLVRLELFDVKIELGELIMLLSKCPKLESVDLQFMHIGGWADELPNELNHVSFLRLQSIDVRCIDHAICVLSLIRSSPHLQRLEISCKLQDDNNNSSLDYLHAQFEETLLNNHARHCTFLEYVEISDSLHCMALVQFMKILFQWAPALMKVKRVNHYDDTHILIAGYSFDRRKQRLIWTSYA